MIRQAVLVHPMIPGIVSAQVTLNVADADGDPMGHLLQFFGEQTVD